MVQFTKKLFSFGGSLAIVVPKEICDIYALQIYDYVTFEVVGKNNSEVKKK